MTRSGWFAALLGVAALLLTGSACGDELNGLQIPSLRGLDTVYVVVPPLKKDVEDDGLTSDLVRQDVELRLRKAGIRVLSKDEVKDKPLTPFLYVRINVLAGKDALSGIYAYSLSLDLRELVTLTRDPKITPIAATWSSGPEVGTVGKARVRQLRDTIGDAVDGFLNDFLAANPKK